MIRNEESVRVLNKFRNATRTDKEQVEVAQALDVMLPYVRKLEMIEAVDRFVIMHYASKAALLVEKDEVKTFDYIELLLDKVTKRLSPEEFEKLSDEVVNELKSKVKEGKI